MGNCALKPKVLSGAGAPAPEELNDSLLEDQKIDAAKSLSNLFLQEKAEKKTKEDEKMTPKNILVTGDQKTVLAEAKSPTKELKGPVTETKSLVKETNFPVVTETKAPADDQKVRNEKAISRGKVIDEMKETETEAKPEKVRREGAAP